MKRYFKSLDYKLLMPIIMLCIIGVVMIYSASSITAIARYNQDPEHYIRAQVIALIGGTFLFFIFSSMPYRVLKNRLFLTLNIGVTGILIALSIFAGETKNGASAWVSIGGFSFQPSEFMKIGLIIMSAFWYFKKQEDVNRFWRVSAVPLYYAVFLFICVYKLLDDLGSSIILLGIAGCMFIGIGMKDRKKWKIVGLVLSIGATVILIVVQFELLSPYQMDRFKAVSSPFAMDHDNESLVGYQLINGYMAMENGGIFGVGIGNSIQKYGRLPEAHTDFIIALIAEELGFIGVCVVLIGLLAIVTRGLVIASKCDDLFGKYLAIGVSSYITVQTVVNIFGITGMLPMTGVPLPLISYGGTSIAATLIGLGILMSVARQEKVKQQKLKMKNQKPNLTVIK